MSKIRIFFDLENPDPPRPEQHNRMSVKTQGVVPDGRAGSFPIREMTEEYGIVEETVGGGSAPAFQVARSPCQDAFTNGVRLWNDHSQPLDGCWVAESVVLLREFVEKMCRNIPGAKVKSSKLYSVYKEYHKSKRPDDKPLVHAKFTTLMKHVSLFETHRVSDGIYWRNLALSGELRHGGNIDKCPSPPQETKGVV